MEKGVSKLAVFIQVKLLLIFLALFLLNGCLSVKPTTTKSGKKYFETFFVGDDGTQYFIKPLVFEEEETDEDLLVDITFRYKNEVVDSAVVNFSIKSQDLYKSIDSFKISNSVIDGKSDKIDLLFNEKTKKAFISRFTTKISLEETKQLFNSSEWDIVLNNNNETKKYIPSKKTQKAIMALRDNVFVVM